MAKRSGRLLDVCSLCGADKGVAVQDQTLALAGLGTAALSFGYCRSCGHIYQLRRASDDLLRRHYEAFSNYTCFDPESARSAPPSNLTKRLLTLAEARAPKGLAYEVGCATGYHLVHFRRAGWDVGGCDPSAKAVAQAKDIFAIELDCGTDAEMLPRRSNLSVVLFSHVLEHMTDPAGALKYAHGALSDDGVVLLEVPCATAPPLVPPGWFAFEHLHYFSETSLWKLLRAAGFEPIETRISYRAELYPVIAIAASKVKTFTPPSADRLAVAQTETFLRELVARDDALWRHTAERVGQVNGPVYVWGAGVHTAQLFDRTALIRDAKVKAIVDRESQKWGLTQADRAIISPKDFLAQHDDEAVVISSFAAEAQIASTLLDAGIPSRNIIRLYS
jgi:SAM-dependent methyltransferase